MGASSAVLRPGPAKLVRRPVRGKDIPDRWMVYTLSFWCGWVALKLFNVQLVEAVMLGHLAYLAVTFFLGGGNASYGGLWVRPGRWYGLIMLTIALLTLSSLRLEKFTPRFGPFFMQNPLTLIAGRFVELGICVFYSVWMAERMRRDPRVRYYAMRMYVLSAAVSAWYTFLSLPLAPLDLPLGWYGGVRGRGGFTEGGPWGTYLITAMIVARVLWLRGQMTKRESVIFTVSMVGAMIASLSRAAGACFLVILLLGIFLRSSFKQKAIALSTLAVVATALWFALDVPKIWKGLTRMRNQAEVLVTMDRDNPNTAYGRIPASVIVPRMIADHPLTGIGWGNYPLLRNNPKYLGFMPPAVGYDLPGWGLISVTAELGFPALIALYVICFYPVYLALRTRSHRMVAMLGLTTPVVYLFGTPLTNFYPWLMSAFALSFLPLQHAHVGLRRRGAPAVPGNLSTGMGVAV